MIATLFSLFGVVSLATLLLTCCSRYFLRAAIHLAQRQHDRLEALRPAWAAAKDEYERCLRHQKLRIRVMGE